MAQIVTEKFTQNLFAPPSGQRKENPTIFDELRWATQHSQNPVEQVLQLISEFHGPWSGMSNLLMQLIAFISSIKGGKKSKDYVSSAKNALKLLEAYKNIPSSVGRKNNITANDMNVPLLREFVTRCQSIHPTVNTFIQQNIGKYPYFQQISDSVGSLAQIVLNSSEINLVDRIKSDGITNMDTNSRLNRSMNSKLFPPIATMMDESSNMLDTLFLRGVRPHNTSLINSDSAKSHGYAMMPDMYNASRGKNAIQECAMITTEVCGPRLALCNRWFPINYQVQNNPLMYLTNPEGKDTIVDRLNMPIVRESILPVASEENKVSLA